MLFLWAWPSISTGWHRCDVFWNPAVIFSQCKNDVSNICFHVYALYLKCAAVKSFQTEIHCWLDHLWGPVSISAIIHHKVIHCSFSAGDDERLEQAVLTKWRENEWFYKARVERQRGWKNLLCQHIQAHFLVKCSFTQALNFHENRSISEGLYIDIFFPLTLLDYWLYLQVHFYRSAY